MKRIVIMQPYYLAWYGFFEQVKLADTYVFYDDVQYVKRSLMNRVDIKTEAGTNWLTIPLRGIHQGDLICDIICYEESRWRADHLCRLELSYRDAPFFEDMYSLASDIFENTSEKLADVTINGIHKVCNYFGLHDGKEFYLSSDLKIGGKSSQRLLNISKELGAGTYLTGMGALRYLDFDLFEKNNVRIEFIDYAKTPYPQLHGSFVPYVTIMDLIANTGREGISYMKSNPVYYREFINSPQAKEYLSKSS